MTTDTVETNAVHHPVVSGARWTTERRRLLAREKELTRLNDEIAHQRRALPWRRVDSDYLFDTAYGPRSLAGLFDGRRQLTVQHFMLAPGWQEGCKACSFMADHVDGMDVHLRQRDVTFVAVSRAPLAEINAFRHRMGWRFRWVSSAGSDFNFDFRVSFSEADRTSGDLVYNFGTQPFQGEEAPGISVFRKDDAGDVFLTYSTFARGVEVMMGTYRLLDLTPEGRQERDAPYKMEWLRHHDRYEPQPAPHDAVVDAACCASRT